MDIVLNEFHQSGTLFGLSEDAKNTIIEISSFNNLSVITLNSEQHTYQNNAFAIKEFINYCKNNGILICNFLETDVYYKTGQDKIHFQRYCEGENNKKIKYKVSEVLKDKEYLCDICSYSCGYFAFKI